MATLEKLVRTVEALKIHQTPSVVVDETMTKKDKISHCVSVTDLIRTQGMKNTPESSKYLAMAMEMYFTLIDDQDADVRMVADENLNRTIRTMGDSNIGRVQVELYKEIKKNGSGRCVRAALWRFSALAPHIRPGKCRAYLVNLLPCLAALARRQEETVHETLAAALPKLFQVLGNFTNDNEVKILLKAFLANIGSPSAVIRRTTASTLTILSAHCRKPVYFSNWMLTTAVSLLLPLSPQTSNHLVTGVLGLCRQLLHTPKVVDDNDGLLQLYELCLHYIGSRDHNLVTGSLETLQQLLKSVTPLLSYLLSTHGGVTQSKLEGSRQSGHLTPPPEDFPPPSLHPDVSLQSISDFADSMADPILSLPGAPMLEIMPEPPLQPPPPIYTPPDPPDEPPGYGASIGCWGDGGVSLHFTARRLCSMFLLTEEKGEVVPDKVVRVSVKTLALNCLGQILHLAPQTWTLPLYLDSVDEFTRITIADLTMYLDHEDPGIRGSAACLLSKVLRGACLESGGSLATWFAGNHQDEIELLHLLISSMQDESAVVLRQALTGLRQALPLLLQSTATSPISNLLQLLPRLASHNYWLVKVELCELLAEQDPLAANYISPGWDAIVVDAVVKLLGDEDLRVRTSAASCVAAISRKIPPPDANLPTTAARNISTMFSIATAPPPFQNESSSTKHSQSTVFRLVTSLMETLKTSKSKHLTAGCIEALLRLADEHPPVQDPSAWGIHSPRARRPSSHSPQPYSCPAASLLQLSLNLMTSISVGQDIHVHSHLLQLAANLYTGLAAHNIRQSSEVTREAASALVADDNVLAELGDELLHHLLHLLCALHHVLEEITPVQPSNKPSLPSLPNATLSPIKKRNTEPSTPVSPPPGDKSFNFKDDKKTVPRGAFYNSPFYMKLYDGLKSSHSIYKSSLDAKSEEKLQLFSGSTLGCFSSLLNYSIGNEIGKYVEESLCYIKSCLDISSSPTLLAVQSLLKCLFKNNIPFKQNNSVFHEHSLENADSGIFDIIITRPYNEMTQTHGLVTEGKEIPLSQPVKRGTTRNHPFRSSSRGTDRSSLASFIRLFEPMVIKALKHYTVTSDVDRQSQVLQLLIQLVRLRVNYCLLDSDQIFIGFVIKQLEAIEEGQISRADHLIPHIFEFLVLLSYDKYHSQVIVDVPKILQLCEGLLAGGQSCGTHVVPALNVVASDLFTGRSSMEGSELETQREVVVSMLQRQLSQPAVLDTLSKVLTWIRGEAGGDEKWRRLSRQILESLLPLLCSHQIELDSKENLYALQDLFKSLNPGALRPLDPLLSALLSCSVDLSSQAEVQRWLGFTIVGLVVTLQLSPEEAVLGRLAELGIMLGSGAGSSLIESSMDSSTSSDPLRQSSAPEMTMATFIFHVVGAATSKLHQLIFSPGADNSTGLEFLKHELSYLMMVLTYILQSGKCCKITKAATAMAKAGQPGALHNVDVITDLVLQIGHSAPTLVTQWLYILVLLEHCSPSVWTRVLQTRYEPNTRPGQVDQAEPAACLHMEVVRRSGLSIAADHLADNTTDSELMSWFIVTQIKDIIRYVEEPQIKELVTVIHRQAASSGLLLQAVSARCDSVRGAEFLRGTLLCLEKTHMAHSGRLLQVLVTKFLVCPILTLARRANSFACQRVETFLTESEEAAKGQLSQSDLAGVLETLSRKKLVRRYGRLVGLLNRLSDALYDLSPLELDDGRVFHPGSVSGVDMDKNWFLQQARRICCSQAPPQECARLLANLGFSDIMAVMTAKDFNIGILEECLGQGITLPNGRAPSIDSLDRLPGLLSDPDRSPGLREVGVQLKEGPPLYRAASQVLLQHIKNVVELCPRPVQIYRPQAWNPTSQEVKYGHRLDDLLSRPEARTLITQLQPAFCRLLTTYPRLPGRRPVLPPNAVLEMARFGVLALELVKWLVAGCREELPGANHTASVCLQVAALTLANPHLAAALALPASTPWVASAALAVTDYLLAAKPGIVIPKLPNEAIKELLVHPSPPSTLVSATSLAGILMLIEQEEKSGLCDILEQIRPVVVGMARLTQFCSIARAPPLAFSLGWQPELGGEGLTQLSNLPEQLLQEVDVLRQLVWRLNTLGWTGRTQFEETWMCLLSVLNVSREDLTNEEVAALSQSTALVVDAISSMLVATLAIPVAGVPGARPLHHPRDSPHHCLLTGRGQQLTAIQNIIHQRLQDTGAPPGLPVDSSVNLERAAQQPGPHSMGYSPVPVAGYGAAQVSLSYVLTCLSYHEEGGADDRQSITSAALPLFLLLREENLAAAGLDTHSCVHFLTDLFSQWLAGQDTPLTVITAAVKAMIMISDIFTQEAQFKWMLSALSDLHKVHPVEDEILSPLLLLGLCKAAAVTGIKEPELSDRLKRGLESALRSVHLPARIAALHGLMYLLQRDPSQESLGLIPMAVDFLQKNLASGRGQDLVNGRCQSAADQLNLLTWSLGFFVLENYESEVSDPDLCSNLVQLCIAVCTQPSIPHPLYTCLLTGLERLVVAGSISGRTLDQVVKLATDLMTDWPPSSVLPATQLFLAAMYSSHPPATDTSARPAPITDPEVLMLMMEQMSILFDCVRRAGPPQAELLADILPQVLIDFFPASDVVNRVISEFISPGQPHPSLLAGVLKHIFRAAVAQDQQNMLTEWVLVSLPNFTRRAQLSHSIWCLSCFFLAASSNPWLQAMFPHLQHRQNRTSTSHEDKRLFCLAASDFYSSLTDPLQREKFVQTFQEVAEPGSPYSDLLSTIQQRKKTSLQSRQSQ